MELTHDLPITVRTLVTGQQSEVGRIDDGYLIQGAALHGAVRAWHRSPATGGHWRIFDVRKQWELDRSLSDPVWSLDPAYLNQVCPDLIRLTYLAAPLPYAQHRVVGTQMLTGRRVWHLREHLWFTLDLYLDADSFQLRRLVLSDRPSAATRWEARFDYSHPNAAVHIALPAGGDHGR